MFKIYSFIIRQFRELNSGGLPEFYRKVRRIPSRGINALIYFLVSFFIIPCLVLFRLIRPILQIKFQFINNERIGHFAVDSSYYLATTPNDNKVMHFFFFIGKSCNSYWHRLVKSELNIHPIFKYFYYFNKFFPDYHKFEVPVLLGSRDIDGIFQKDVKRFRICDKDSSIAKEWLKSKGWKENEKFICLLVRDSAYLKNRGNYDYHNYRDTEIESYAKVIRYLIDQGYWVVRLGKTAIKPSPISSNKIIDYPFIGDQNDLYDIWLILNCFFAISIGSGLDILPTVYNNPSVCFVNALPLGNFHSFQKNIWTPKHLIWKSSGKYLNLKEHLIHSYHHSSKYEKAGISITDLREDEICNAVEEQLLRLEGTWIESDEDQELQKRFWITLKSWNKFKNLHNWIHPEARIGTHYLRKMGEEYFE